MCHTAEASVNHGVPRASSAKPVVENVPATRALSTARSASHSPDVLPRTQNPPSRSSAICASPSGASIPTECVCRIWPVRSTSRMSLPASPTRYRWPAADPCRSQTRSLIWPKLGGNEIVKTVPFDGSIQLSSAPGCDCCAIQTRPAESTVIARAGAAIVRDSASEPSSRRRSITGADIATQAPPPAVGAMSTTGCSGWKRVSVC